MNHTEYSIITPAYSSTSNLENGYLEGRFYQHDAAHGLKTDRAQITTGRYSRSQVHNLRSAGDFAKRKYEDMTSSEIEEVEAENDHELSYKLSSFSKNKKRRPPESAGNPMLQAQEPPVHVGEDKNQCTTADRYHRSSSRVAVTPDICGDSDLTAENYKAEESSRSSNNDGCADESVSKWSNREVRSVSSLGVLHYILDHKNGGREVRLSASSEGPSDMSNLFNRNDAAAENITTLKEMEEDDMKNRDDVSKLGPAASTQLGSGSSDQEEPSSTVTNTVPSQLWGSSNQEWLQLGVGSTRETSASSKQADPASEGTPLSFGQGHAPERVFARRTNAAPIRFSTAGNCEAGDIDDTFPADSNIHHSPVHWQLRRGPSAPRSELSCDPSIATNLNPVAFRSMIPTPVRINVASASDIEKTDLCLFGNSIVTSAVTRPELVLPQSRGAPETRQSAGNAASEKFRAIMTSPVVEDSYERRGSREQFHGVMHPTRNEESDFAIQADMGLSSGLYNQAGPTFASTVAPSVDIQFRSAQGAGLSLDHKAFQFQRDSRPSSFSALMQTTEDLRHGHAGYPWLSGPAVDSGPKQIPLAKNFQGWSSTDITSNNIKLTTVNAQHGAMDKHSIPNDQQQAMMRGSDDWGSSSGKVGPDNPTQFQSQHVPEGLGSSVALQAANCREKNVGIHHEAPDSLVAWKRAIENIQNRPRWSTPEALNLASVASWCLNGNLPGIRGDSQREGSDGEGPLTSSMLSERVPVHSRFAGDHINLAQSAKPPQRQSWQQADAGQTKLHTTAGRSKFQVLPPGSRETSHAGLWFILQSAENHLSNKSIELRPLLDGRNGEQGGLPQISKAYLRIKDGKIPVSAVKKYLVTKLGLASESEVEITCKGQPVVPSLPLQHVRDVIWFSSVSANKEKMLTSAGERDETAVSETCPTKASNADRDTAAAATIFSKDILMVLTYRRHPRTHPLSPLLAS